MQGFFDGGWPGLSGQFDIEKGRLSAANEGFCVAENANGTNEIGFDALPSGYYNEWDGFQGQDSITFFNPNF